jgi:hypothetical protein
VQPWWGVWYKLILEILLIKEMRKGISNSGIYGCAVEKNKISLDEDLLINTLKGYETSVKQGERISMIRP